MYRTYIPDLPLTGGSFLLQQEESKHLVKVLRHKTGDTIAVLNGQGYIATGTLTHADIKATQIRIEKVNQLERPYPEMALLIAPTKNPDRIEWLVEKATENGVSHILVFESARTERHRISAERLERIAIAAIKQSGNPYLPQIRLEKALAAAMDHCQDFEQKFMAWCPVDQAEHISQFWEPGKKTACLIGPEGDFTPEEAALAQERGWKTVSLGRLTLRTETAGLYVVIENSVINSR